uniref:Uncharacterized protein n=1 Tax=viral metagenome TaxID=1070528 RepID=A0A6H1ZLC6_9ZZZZ
MKPLRCEECGQWEDSFWKRAWYWIRYYASPGFQNQEQHDEFLRRVYKELCNPLNIIGIDEGAVFHIPSYKSLTSKPDEDPS